MIPDEAIDAAAREFYGEAFDDVPREELKYVLDQMRAALAAAAPHLMAAALYEAADVHARRSDGNWLRSRAYKLLHPDPHPTDG